MIEKTFVTNCKQKKAGVATLIANKIDCQKLFQKTWKDII